MKTNRLIVAGLFAFCFAPHIAQSAQRESKMVTRIETATVTLKGGRLNIRATGMATTGSTIMPKGGTLVRRGPLEPNKDGFLEYELQFNPPSKSSDKLYPVKASLTERHVAGETKGVRVFAEFNHTDALLPQPKEKKKKK